MYTCIHKKKKLFFKKIITCSSSNYIIKMIIFFTMKVKECLGIKFLIFHMILLLPYFLKLLLTTGMMQLQMHITYETSVKVMRDL